MENQRQRKSRPGFHDNSVRGISFAIVVFGCLSFGIGLGSLIYSLTLKCKYRNVNHNNDNEYYNGNSYYHSWQNQYDEYEVTTIPTTTTTPYYYDDCHYYRTYSSAGIWSGLMFIASGVIGALASKRRTTCFIVCMMVLSIVTTWVAVCGTALSVLANFDNSFYYNDYYAELISSYPLELIIPNCVVGLFCVVVFILSWINFGFACGAVCCNGMKGYPSMKQRNPYQYQTLQNAPMMYATQPMTAGQEGGVPAAPMVQPMPNPQLEPVYLVQGRQIIGMMPQQNAQFPVMGNTSVQINPPAPNAVPPQLV